MSNVDRVSSNGLIEDLKSDKKKSNGAFNENIDEKESVK